MPNPGQRRLCLILLQKAGILLGQRKTDWFRLVAIPPPFEEFRTRLVDRGVMGLRKVPSGRGCLGNKERVSPYTIGFITATVLSRASKTAARRPTVPRKALTLDCSA
ncbi:MAG: hypothetical protein Ct9H300mP16_15850 [Pseudomonadota bacterium]|nr:MAG: hypothetical protein Ct9H300mP16_15850 [Pseudomonadota bacterium]